MRKQDKADQSFITAEQKDLQDKRNNFLRRIQLERDLVKTANAAPKMAACVEALVGGDRKVLELSVSSYASTSSELVRIFNQLSEFYRTETKDADQVADH